MHAPGYGIMCTLAFVLVLLFKYTTMPMWLCNFSRTSYTYVCEHCISHHLYVRTCVKMFIICAREWVCAGCFCWCLCGSDEPVFVHCCGVVCLCFNYAYLYVSLSFSGKVFARGIVFMLPYIMYGLIIWRRMNQNINPRAIWKFVQLLHNKTNVKRNFLRDTNSELKFH